MSGYPINFYVFCWGSYTSKSLDLFCFMKKEKQNFSPEKLIENWREDLSIKISFRFWKINGIVPTSDTTIINNVCLYLDNIF